MDTFYFAALAAPSREDMLIPATRFYVEFVRWVRSFNRRSRSAWQRSMYRSYQSMWRKLRLIMRGK